VTKTEEGTALDALLVLFTPILLALATPCIFLSFKQIRGTPFAHFTQMVRVTTCGYYYFHGGCKMCRVLLPVCLAGTMLALGGADFAAGRGRCRTSYATPPPCPAAPVRFEERTITCYRPEYRTAYQTVKHTVYRCVPESRQREIEETVLVPHTRQIQKTRTVMVPVTREVERHYTAIKTELRREQRERTVCVPVVKQVEREYTVCVPDTHANRSLYRLQKSTRGDQGAGAGDHLRTGALSGQNPGPDLWLPVANKPVVQQTP
jgi:hypothetical protein